MLDASKISSSCFSCLVLDNHEDLKDRVPNGIDKNKCLMSAPSQAKSKGLCFWVLKELVQGTRARLKSRIGCYLLG